MKVKKLHVDGGGEYKGQLTPILKSLGIKYEPTPPRTPECNGKAERMNRTLNNMVRAMLAQANMPNSFWASAMKMATYLRNRLPSSAIDDEIPYERWYRKPLRKKDLKLLKPFGCIVWDNVPKENRKKHCRNKLFDHGTKGCFIGYVSWSTYSYYDFARKTILQSHNLTFMETEFPQRSDFGDLPDEAFKRLRGPDPKRHSHDEEDESAMNTDSDSEDEHEHVVAPFVPATPTTPTTPVTYDEIVVEQQPPPDEIFSIIFSPLADSIPKSFKDAVSHPDRKFW
jgi:hypothetical protein